MREPSREARAGSERGRTAFERLLVERPPALAALRARAHAALEGDDVSRFQRVGEIFASLFRSGSRDHDSVSLVLIEQATGLPPAAVQAMLDGDQPALAFRADALVDLGDRGFGLTWEAFEALLRRDAASFPDALTAEDVEAALARVRFMWHGATASGEAGAG